ncbi:MAG: hypothetical protein NTX24_01525 [Candidatus Pacearchaeota archaeon]|nr:hypothetical protein [Candidatus Pacearchaeota archaeon]
MDKNKYEPSEASNKYHRNVRIVGSVLSAFLFDLFSCAPVIIQSPLISNSGRAAVYAPCPTGQRNASSVKSRGGQNQVIVSQSNVSSGSSGSSNQSCESYVDLSDDSDDSVVVNQGNILYPSYEGVNVSDGAGHFDGCPRMIVRDRGQEPRTKPGETQQPLYETRGKRGKRASLTELTKPSKPTDVRTQVFAELASNSTSLGIRQQSTPRAIWNAYGGRGDLTGKEETDWNLGVGGQYAAVPNHILTVGAGAALSLVGSNELIPTTTFNVLSEGGKLADFILNAGSGLFFTRANGNTRADLSALLAWGSPNETDLSNGIVPRGAVGYQGRNREIYFLVAHDWLPNEKRGVPPFAANMGAGYVILDDALYLSASMDVGALNGEGFWKRLVWQTLRQTESPMQRWDDDRAQTGRYQAGGSGLFVKGILHPGDKTTGVNWGGRAMVRNPDAVLLNQMGTYCAVNFGQNVTLPQGDMDRGTILYVFSLIGGIGTTGAGNQRQASNRSYEAGLRVTHDTGTHKTGIGLTGVVGF